MSDTYVKKINGNLIAASEVVPNSPLADALAAIGAGAFAVVSLTTGANPHPDVSNPSTKIIYLTKTDTAGLTDPYTEWIYTTGNEWAIIGETSIDLSGYKTKQTAFSVSGLGTLKTITALSQNANGEISGTASDIQSATTAQKGVVQLTGSIGATVASENNKAASEKAVRDALDGMVGDVYYDQYTRSIKKTVGGTASDVVTVAKLKEDMNLGTAAEKNVPESGDASATEVVMGNDSRLGKADSAVQGVKLAGASSALTPDANKVVTIPNAVATGETGATNGLMTAADKKKLSDLKEITVTSTSVSDGTNTFNKYVHPTTAGNKHVPDGGSSGQVLVYGGASGTASWGAVPGLSNKADKVTGATNGDFAALDANGNLTDSGKKASDFATAAQGTKADSAIQGVKVNSTALTPDANKVVDIPAATDSVYGVVTIETVTI